MIKINELQKLKVDLNIIVIIELNFTSVNDSHCEKAWSWIVWTEDGISNCFNDTHLQKAPLSILCKEEGRSISTSDEHEPNALLSILCMHDGNVTSLNDEQL